MAQSPHVLEGQKNTIGIMAAMLHEDVGGMRFLIKEADDSTIMALASLATLMLVEREGGPEAAEAWLHDSALKLAVATA